MWIIMSRPAGGVVGVSCAIVVLLFGMNPLGTAKIGATYAPIVLLWFLFNIITACYNIHTYYPGVFKAFSPYFGEIPAQTRWLRLGIAIRGIL